MTAPSRPRLIERDDVPQLFGALGRAGYVIVGPTVRDGAIVYDRLESDQDLPIGWTDEQDGGTYRLERREDDALFGYVVGPHSWKQFLFPPRARLCSVQLTRDGMQVEPEPSDPTRYAFIGVRACELAAIGIQDRVFLDGPYVDEDYRSRREGAFVVAVNCVQAGNTCFCASMGTGPRVEGGYDLALTELLTRDRHVFLMETGTARGEAIAEQLPHRPAAASDVAEARDRIADASQRMGRTIDTQGIKELLYEHPDHPRWDEVAQRCLTCGNCTLVCPTCFCSTTRDVTELTGHRSERWREWDSCFSQEFSYIHGGSVRVSAKSRYRQWMTHKLASWIDQFGTSGCVGCGRCITWCPVGIDITEEARAIRDGQPPEGPTDAETDP